MIDATSGCRLSDLALLVICLGGHLDDDKGRTAGMLRCSARPWQA
jgi:hypothetical protein